MAWLFSGGVAEVQQLDEAGIPLPDQRQVADDDPELLTYRLNESKLQKQAAIEAQARAIATARLPADLQTKADAAKAAIEDCTTEAELAALAEPDWPK